MKENCAFLERHKNSDLKDCSIAFSHTPRGLLLDQKKVDNRTSLHTCLEVLNSYLENKRQLNFVDKVDNVIYDVLQIIFVAAMEN